MNFSTMQADVTSVVRDPTNTFITTTDVPRWINQAQRDLAHRLKILRKEATGTTTGTIALPADFVEPLTLRLGTSTDEVAFVDDEMYNSYLYNDSSPTISIARIFGANIEVYPTLSSATAYTLRYVYEPADLSAGGDESALPAVLHPRMVDYARWQAMLKLGKQAEADTYLALYESDLPRRSLGRTRFLPPVLAVTYEPSPIENQY